MINPILIPGSPMVAVQGTFPPQTASSVSAARIVEQSDANDKADPRLGSQAASAMSSRDVRHRSRPPINISGTTLAAQSPSCDVRVAPTTPLRITSMIDTTTMINTVSKDDQCLATSAMSSRDVNHHKRPGPCKHTLQRKHCRQFQCQHRRIFRCPLCMARPLLAISYFNQPRCASGGQKLRAKQPSS